jgi:ComF family protein
LTSLWEYDGVVRKAILKLKYNFGLEIARELSGCASQKIMEDKRIFLKDPTLVPIPLFWYRKNWRGFNQTEELGRKIAAILGWKFEPNTLIRTKSNPPQAGLMRADRLQNVAGVFSVLSGLTKTLPNSNIILFDDVWTTGTTLKEAAKTLKQNGAKRVWGLTLAR